MDVWDHISRLLLVAWVLTITLMIALSTGQGWHYESVTLPWDVISDGYTITASR